MSDEDDFFDELLSEMFSEPRLAYGYDFIRGFLVPVAATVMIDGEIYHSYLN